ncbi:RNA polymerase sigma-70 factor (ECF subfamily) [Motilibacter rhizosphaerae]|uniref:RNA polymerase sigma-70 factor (ECF subfamily) n=1 Tax=Motilibacter rhizosphaerae TaxID=598652 RepID=A0A4V2F2R8_9ACTN|nr:sigma-70 family RNA polymerase sigma factor [Motilibacter rhizosphaerae]RZS79406.1 RNA polymerase sigma-70 factor (ECF subfamily) [Motilibacter rhizosphaerae]
MPDQVTAGGRVPAQATRADDSREWLAALDGEPEQAVARLHALLLRAARAEVNRRAPRWGITGPELDDLACQAADDACLAVLRKRGQFRGESRFTTWAYAFVVLEVSSKLPRHAWREREVALADDDWSRLPDRLGIDPGASAEARELAEALQAAVEGELTERQRVAFHALVTEGVPVDVLAGRLGTTRGALYKTVFDARRKIRDSLVATGHLDPRREERR